MPCPQCQLPRTQEQPKQSSPGYRAFRCTRRFNERSGTPFNDLSLPTDVVFLVVLWRLRYPVSLRHLAEIGPGARLRVQPRDGAQLGDDTRTRVLGAPADRTDPGQAAW